MEKTFNELFDDFFKKNINKKNLKSNPDINQQLSNEANRIIDILTKFGQLGDTASINEEIEAELDKTLGKPDKTEFYNENNLFYEKRTWHTPTGDVVKLMISDDPSITIAPPAPKSLELQLEEAVAAEDYEKASAIRDEIKKNKKKITRTKKTK